LIEDARLVFDEFVKKLASMTGVNVRHCINHQLIILPRKTHKFSLKILCKNYLNVGNNFEHCGKENPVSQTFAKVYHEKFIKNRT